MTRNIYSLGYFSGRKYVINGDYNIYSENGSTIISSRNLNATIILRIFYLFLLLIIPFPIIFITPIVPCNFLIGTFIGTNKIKEDTDTIIWELDTMYCWTDISGRLEIYCLLKCSIGIFSMYCCSSKESFFWDSKLL